MIMTTALGRIPARTASTSVILSRGKQILPGDRGCGDLVFSHLRMAEQVQYTTPDEVARNGAHLRITSARGFLKAPLAYLE
ncbi:MAG TPA: hypothetical protein VIL63_01160 [Terriglobales bacterium]